MVGIPAHNEENNIGHLLQSILSQKGEHFILESVVVACDGCTDSTSQIVSGFAEKSPLVKLINDGRRIGQAARLNEFYQDLKSDIFITFDADVKLGNEFVLEEIVKAFKDEKVAVVGGTDLCIPQKTFVGKSLEVYQQFWHEMISKVKNGDNVHHHPGCISAGRGSFLKTISMPLNIVANDHFLYFEALKQGYRFKWAKNAIIYIKVPSTLRDYLKQTTRFHDSAANIRNYFGEWVEEYYSIPFSVKLRAYAVTFIKNPFYLVSALALQLVQRLVSFRYSQNSNNGVWETVKSSK